MDADARKEVLKKALLKEVREHREAGRSNLTFSGFEPEVSLSLLEALGEEADNGGSQVYATMIGAENPEALAEWAAARGWDRSRFGVDSPHAVQVRNEAPDEALKLAFVLREEPRVHSLTHRGYQNLGPRQAIAQICAIAHDRAVNQPQRELWKALVNERISHYFALDAILGYYSAVFPEPSEGDIVDPTAPREGLPMLGLLPDDSLLTENYKTEPAVVKRLVRNEEITQRLRRADEEDRQKAMDVVESSEGDERQELEEGYRAMLRLADDDLDALRDLPLSVAQVLLGAKKSRRAHEDEDPGHEEDSDQRGDEEEGDEEGGNGQEARRRFNDLTTAVIRLFSNGERELARQVVELAQQRLADENDEIDGIAYGDVDVGFSPDDRAVAIGRAASTQDRFGCSLVSTDQPLEVVVREPSRYVDEVYDDVERRELEHLLRRVRESLAQSFEGEKLFADYVGLRARVLQYRDVLAVAPVACLVAQEGALEAVTQAMSAYEALLVHLSHNFSTIKTKSPEGAQKIYGEILGLDMVRVFGQDEEALVLSPVNPLTLWKHAEFAHLVLESGQSMSGGDREFLEAEATEVPEPLLAVRAPAFLPGGAAEFGYSGRLGALSTYGPVATETSDVGEYSLELAARKLAALYPPVRENLRVMLIDPVSTRHASRAIKKLVEDKQNPFRRATLVVARTPHGAVGGNLLPQDKAMDNLISEGRVVVEEERGSLEDVREALRRRPVHLLGISGERRKDIEIIEQEGTRLHPVSLPHRLVADVLTGRVTLRPRSMQPEGEEHLHPFGLYKSLVAELSGNPRSEHSIRYGQDAPLDAYADLFEQCQFFVVTGHLAERSTQVGTLRLAQGGKLAGDTVFTAYPDRIRRGIDRLVFRTLNYNPPPNSLQKLLEILQEVGGEGLFATISDKEVSGFSGTALRGQLGLAVALDWYYASIQGSRRAVLSLDTHLARQWLRERDDRRRPDLVGFGIDEDGRPRIDVIEVKSYRVTGDEDVAETPALGQIVSVASLLRQMLDFQGNLLIDRRRELLRLQLYREWLVSGPVPDPEWVQILNDVLDGQVPASLNLLLIELGLERNNAIEDRRSPLPGDIAKELKTDHLRLVRLSEPYVRQRLENMVGVQPQPQETGTILRNKGEGVDGGGPSTPEGDSTQILTAPVSVSDTSEAETEDGGAKRNDVPDVSTDSGPDGGTARGGGSPQTATEPQGFEPSREERKEISRTAQRIYRALQDLGVKLEPVEPDLADVGPSVVRYRVKLRSGENDRTIKSRASDLMRELAAEREPIIDNLRGTNYLYVDLPRPQRHAVPMIPMLDRLEVPEDQLKAGLMCPFGVTPQGRLELFDLAKLPHMLVAGSTGSGKTMFLYSLVVGLTRLYSPDQLDLTIIDPKETDFVFFEGMPHIRSGRVLTDSREAVGALMRLIDEELPRRTEVLKEYRSRDIWSHNERYPGSAIAPAVVIIDEFADLADVMDRPARQRFDQALRRLAQRARNVGIHLVLATQRPTTDVVNGNLKNNLPCRVSLRLASQVDSRTVLDRGGAENLLGNGDMLVLWNGNLSRLQGFYLSENDLGRGV